MTDKEKLKAKCQQHNNPLVPQLAERLFLVYFFISTNLKIMSTFLGAFLLYSTHYLILFLIFVDYLVITAWYLWLGRLATQTKTLLRGIIAHFSCLSVLLLAVAIIGTVLERWNIAIEVITSKMSLLKLN